MTTNAQPAIAAVEPRTVISDRPYSYWYLAAIVFGLACAAALWLLRSTVHITVHTWATSETYSYGYLILPIVLYLAWDRRRRLHAVPLRPFWPGLVLVAFSAALWFLGSIAETNLVQQIAMVCAINALLLSILGWRAARTLAGAMALLYFVIPVGDSLVPRLQDITAVAATWLLTLTRVPAVLEGRLITVPGQQWQVAEACSGARYLLSSAILGLAFAFLAFRSWKRRILMIAASILVPVIANCLRAYGIIMIGYLSNNTLAHGIDHVIYGWVFFLVCMLLVFAIAARHMEPPAAPELLPLDQRKSSSSIAQLIAAAVACCIILLLPVAALNRLEAREVADSANLSAARTNDHWISTGLLVPRWISQALDTSTGDTEAFRPLAPGADRPVYVYSGSSRAAARVLGSGERLLNQNYWTVLGEADRTVEVNGHPFELHEMRTQGPGPHRLIWMWCLVNGVETNSPIALKLLQAKDGMLGRRAAVQIVAIAADYDFDAKEAAPSLLNFLNNATPALTGSAR